MPYIDKQIRPSYDPLILELLDSLEHGGYGPGDLNYVISRIIWRIFDLNPRYATGNNLLGILECVKQEFYRRKLAPYEDAAIQKNGDINEPPADK